MNNKEKYQIFINKNQGDIPVWFEPFYLDLHSGPNNWDVLVYEGAGSAGAGSAGAGAADNGPTDAQSVTAAFVYTIKSSSDPLPGTVLKSNAKGRGAFTRIIKDLVKSPSIIMPGLVKFSGPLIIYPPGQKYEQRLAYEKKIFNYFIKNLPFYKSFDMRFYYNVDNWLPFYWKGFTQSTCYSYEIALNRTQADIENDFNSSLRNKIKKTKALVKNGTLKIVTPHIKDFIRVCSMSYKRQGLIMPFTEDFLIRRSEVMESQKQSLLMGALLDNRLVSVLWLIWDNKRAWLNMAGDDPEYRKCAAAQLLSYEALFYAKNVLKTQYFDFEGSMIESVERTRRAFGAKQKQYFRIKK